MFEWLGDDVLTLDLDHLDDPAYVRGCTLYHRTASGNRLFLWACNGRLSAAWLTPRPAEKAKVASLRQFGGLAVGRDYTQCLGMFAGPDSVTADTEAGKRWFLTGFADVHFVRIPLWMLLLLFATYPVVVTTRSRFVRWRRRRNGHCRHCGYDLTGDTTGRCPECGIAIEAAVAPARRRPWLAPIRVVEWCRHWRMLIGVIGLSAAAGVAASRWVLDPLVAAVPAVAFIVPLLSALWLVRSCHHAIWHVLYGAGLGIAALVVPLLAWSGHAYGLAGVTEPLFLRALAVRSLAAAVGGSWAMLTWLAVYRVARRQVVEQDGTVCPACGGCIEQMPLGPCPHCGAAFDAARLARLRNRERRRWGRRGLPAIVWILFIAATLWAVIIHGRRSPALNRLALTAPQYWQCLAQRSPAGRGQRIAELRVALRCALLTPVEFRALVGDPDLAYEDENGTHYLYDSPVNGIDRVTYVSFRQGKPASVCWNAPDVNDHSRYKPFTSK